MKYQLNLIVLIIVSFIFLNSQTADARQNKQSLKEQKPVKEWNFLIFLNGVNSLDSFGSMNINQMETVGSNDKINILVQWGTFATEDIRRLYIRKDSDASTVTSPVVKNIGPSDMGDWHQLVDFANWAQDNYPAKHTFLVVWNHGSGWHNIMNQINGLTRGGIGIQDISSDDRTGNIISTEQLGMAIKEISSHLGRKIDIYASDACLMGMIEVAAEMKDHVSYYVGSQDLEPGQGWPYDEFLSKWVAHPEYSSKDISQLLSSEYAKAYSGGIYGNESATMSVFDMVNYGKFVDGIRAIQQDFANLDAKSLQRIKALGSQSKSFYYSDYVDALDFFNKVKKEGIPLMHFQDLENAHAEFVISNDQNQGDDTHGLSFWMPTTDSSFSNLFGRYKNLTFNQDSNWGNFLQVVNKK